MENANNVNNTTVENAPNAENNEEKVEQTPESNKEKAEKVAEEIKAGGANVLSKAGHGAAFIGGLVSRDSNAFKEQKASGAELDQQLAVVQKQSKEYKDQNAMADEERIKRAANQKLISYRYKVKDSTGKITSNTFEAPSVNDVRVFLTNEGYEVIEIKERSKYDFDIGGNGKIKNGELAFLLTQLSTYIKAGIPLINSVRILAKQTQNANEKKILNKVVYELVTGEKFSIALEKQGKAFPNFLVNMVKTSEMTGDLASALDEMAAYYQETDASAKAMKSALIYPAVILTATIGALVFIITYVVPQFATMFTENGSELPGITKFVMDMSAFFQNYWWVLILVIVAVIIVYSQLFKRVRSFRKAMQTFYMHLPVFGNIIIYNEVATFTRTFAQLLNHNVFITDSMDILAKITSNEVYKELIARTIINLSKGGKISESFKGEWAFPVVAYEMLVTGESTGQLGVMMGKVAEHFARLHSNATTTLKSLIEPMVIIVLAGGVGFIVMSIIMPMFDLYSAVG